MARDNFFCAPPKIGPRCHLALWLIVAGAIALGPHLSMAEEVPPPAPKKIIRSIEVEVREIFDRPNEERFYRWLNAAKINTGEDVIRRELLFKEGDEFDEFRVNESLRVIRALRYIRRVEIVPTFDGEFVDLRVIVQDTWTVIPQAAYSSGTGNKRTAIGVSESDLLGRGKRVELLYDEEENRQSYEAVVEDPRIWGSEYRALGAIFDRTDGTEVAAQFGNPFRSLLDESGWSVNAFRADSAGRLFENTDETYIFHRDGIDLSGGYTIALGDPAKLRRRLTFGYNYLESSFSQASSDDYKAFDLDPSEVSNDPALLAPNRRFTGPAIAYQAIEPDYIYMNYIDRFDRVVDYNLGLNYGGALQFAPEALGSIADALLITTDLSEGYKFSSGSFIRGEIGADGRYHLDGGGVQNGVLRAALRYYYVFGPLYWKELYLGKHTFAAGLTGDFAHDLDADRQQLLGGDNGLRGYETRTFDGDNRLVLNIEQRVHLAEDVLKLVSLGAAAFVDVGGASDESLGNVLSDSIYSDVGVGFRIGFPRSSGGRVLRVDLAFPLRSGPDGSDKFEPRFIVSGGQLFNAGNRSESSQSEETTIGSRFSR